MSTTPQFEIPVDMRKMTEQTLEHVRTAIHSYVQFFQRAVPGDVMGGSELTDKILGYAERNVESAFEFAQRLVQVRDIQSLMSVQAEFIQAQMQAMTEQAKDLSETATKALTERAKTPTTGGLSSRCPSTRTALSRVFPSRAANPRAVPQHGQLKQLLPLNGASASVMPEVEDVGHKVLGSVL